MVKLSLFSEKNRFVIVIFALFAACLSSPLKAVDCSTVNITLTTQSEVDSFQSTYGGGGICDRVEQLTIQSAGITSVAALSDLKVVAQFLYISQTFLSDLEGLHNLEVLSSLSLEANTRLNSIEQLSKITNLSTIAISGSSALTDLDGLHNVTQAREIQLTGNSMLSSLSGLSSVVSISRSLSIEENHSLSNLDGLSSLESIDGTLSIRGNNGLLNLTGLSSLNYFGSLAVTGNLQLVNLDGLQGVTSINDVVISSNPSLKNLLGLENVTTQRGYGWIRIEDNQSLENIDSLQQLSFLPYGIIINGNESLLHVNGLAGVTSYGTILRISYNNSLSDLSGLSSLLSGGDLYLWGNAIQDVDGLSNLNSLSGRLEIRDNYLLKDLDGLSQLESLGSDLSMTDNWNLSLCGGLRALLDAVDDGIPGPGPGPAGIPDVGGDVSIANNLSGCNSVEEIVIGVSAYSVGGTVVGLNGDGLVLQNNGVDDLAIMANGDFEFPTTIEDGGSYNVTVKTQPSNPSQICTVTNAHGVIAGSSVSDVTVTCTTNMYTVGGSVSGFEGDYLTLQNSGADDLNLSANGTFTFPTSMPDGSEFSVTVIKHPENPSQTCSVSNGTGILNGTNVTDVQVTCSAKRFTVGGSVSGLEGSGLRLQNNGSDGLLFVADAHFTFPTPLEDGSAYSVTVKAQPSEPDQICSVLNGHGTISGDDITNVEVLCDTTTFSINSGLNDAWFNPETDGQGFLISVLPESEIVFLAWFTYDTELPPDEATANLGDPGHRWLTAQGTFADNQSVMDIVLTSGGLFDKPAEVSRTDPPGSDGTLILTFDDCYTGTIEYDIPSINRLGTVPIQRIVNDNAALCEELARQEVVLPESDPQNPIAFSGTNDLNPGLNDAWFNPATDGQGILVSVLPESEIVFLAWFTYDTELPSEGATANLGDPGHRWLTAQGPYIGGEAELDLVITSGGLFDSQAVINRTDPPGSDGVIRLNFNDCYSGIIEYDIPTVGMEGSVPIQRIVTDNVPLCEALIE